MFINGCKDYNKYGEAVNTGLFIGRVTTAGERKTSKSGKDWASASVKVCNTADGGAKFMTIKSFGGDDVDTIAELNKGDTIWAAGRLDTREYNGKTYTDMAVESIVVMGKANSERKIPDTVANMANLAKRADDFAMLDDDDDLPFN